MSTMSTSLNETLKADSGFLQVQGLPSNSLVPSLLATSKARRGNSRLALEWPAVGSGQRAHWACAGGGPPGRLREL